MVLGGFVMVLGRQRWYWGGIDGIGGVCDGIGEAVMVLGRQ